MLLTCCAIFSFLLSIIDCRHRFILFVGNLPFDTSAEELTKKFEVCGACSVISRRNYYFLLHSASCCTCEVTVPYYMKSSCKLISLFLSISGMYVSVQVPSLVRVFDQKGTGRQGCGRIDDHRSIRYQINRTLFCFALFCASVFFGFKSFFATFVFCFHLSLCHFQYILKLTKQTKHKALRAHTITRTQDQCRVDCGRRRRRQGSAQKDSGEEPETDERTSRKGTSCLIHLLFVFACSCVLNGNCPVSIFYLCYCAALVH